MNKAIGYIVWWLFLCAIGTAVMVAGLHIAREAGLTGMTAQERALVESLTRERKAAAEAMSSLAEQLRAINEEQAR